MFYEQIGEYTRAHLMEHLPAELAAEEDRHDDTIKLVMPKTVDVASMVGGVMQVARDTLPQVAINILNKQASPTNDNLYAYAYPGQLITMVGGRDSDSVDKLAYRYGSVIERLVKLHPHLHQNQEDEFTLIGWLWNNSTFSGAMQLERPDSPVGELWVHAVGISVNWITSEFGPSDQDG